MSTTKTLHQLLNIKSNKDQSVVRNPVHTHIFIICWIHPSLCLWPCRRGFQFSIDLIFSRSACSYICFYLWTQLFVSNKRLKLPFCLKRVSLAVFGVIACDWLYASVKQFQCKNLVCMWPHGSLNIKGKLVKMPAGLIMCHCFHHTPVECLVERCQVCCASCSFFIHPCSSRLCSICLTENS